MPIQIKEVHGDLIRSIAQRRGTKPAKKKALRQRIIPAYEAYREQLDSAFEEESEDAFLAGAVAAINAYKDIIDCREFTVKGEPPRFLAQQKVHSTVMEEFWAMMMGSLLKRSSHELPEHTTVYLGPGQALQNIIFAPKNLANLLAGPSETDPWFQVRLKDRDCMMAIQVHLQITTNGIEARIPIRKKGEEILPEKERTRPLSAGPIYLPFISMECKQYADKTMLDNAISAATHLKVTNPFCLELITIELNKLSDLNISGSGIDNLYLLRRQQLKAATYRSGVGPTDTVDVSRRKPIDLDVVKSVCGRIKRHLNADGFFWSDMQNFFRTGRVMGD